MLRAAFSSPSLVGFPHDKIHLVKSTTFEALHVILLLAPQFHKFVQQLQPLAPPLAPPPSCLVPKSTPPGRPAEPRMPF